MITALIVGMMTGLFFRPLALVPVSFVFVLGGFLLSDESGMQILASSALSVLILNGGFLLGAVTRWQLSRHGSGKFV